MAARSHHAIATSRRSNGEAPRNAYDGRNVGDSTGEDSSITADDGQATAAAAAAVAALLAGLQVCRAVGTRTRPKCAAGQTVGPALSLVLCMHVCNALPCH
jgi:hypothetical protein